MLSQIPEVFSTIFHKIYSQFGDMELYTSFFLLAMIAVWTIGTMSNTKIANSVFTQYKSALASEFAEPGKSLLKDSNSHHFTYSTGRVRCSGLLVSIRTAPRHDFLSRFVFSWMWKALYQQDRMELEVLDPEMDSGITAFLCRKYLLNTLSGAIPEVKKFCKPCNGTLEQSVFGKHSSSTLTGFTLTCDAGGKAACAAVLPKLVVPGIVLENLKSLYVSSEAKSIKLELEKIPTKGDMGELIHFVTSQVLDQFCAVKLSESVRAEVAAQRAADAEKAAIAEAVNKKQESKQKNLSPQELLKLEEKRKAKQQKKQLKQGKIMLL